MNQNGRQRGRLIAELRKELDCSTDVSGHHILSLTENTFLRFRVEMRLAWRDIGDAIKESLTKRRK